VLRRDASKKREHIAQVLDGALSFYAAKATATALNNVSTNELHIEWATANLRPGYEDQAQSSNQPAFGADDEKVLVAEYVLLIAVADLAAHQEAEALEESESD
jgi:hypothetical protein